MRSIIVLLSSVVCLSACSGLLTSNQNVDKFYTLNAVNHFPDTTSFIDESFVIEEPIFAKGLDSDQIMLMRSQQRIDYYAGARWANKLNKMVQISLIESFENSQLLAKVASEQGGLNAG
ncbi:MAG TPA: ABC-type transport auxiliary lipoprotein family protein, partial [Gammaproteobacteria bacterium]|nr:ABC-type transport auxiliary lipoprotein family protein [Gammaproteobacteria bacterium]